MPNDPSTPYKVTISVLAVAIAVVLGAFGVLGATVWRQFEVYEKREQLRRDELSALKAEHRRQAAYLKRATSDPAFFERVVRDRLGYSREGEVIVRFRE